MSVNNTVTFPTGDRPTTDLNIGIVAAASFGLTALIFGIVYMMKGTFLRDLLIGRYENDPGRYIFQSITTFVWGLSTFYVIFKRIKIHKEFKALDEAGIPEDLDLEDLPTLLDLHRKLMKRAGMAKSIVHTRIAKALGMWINTQDFERTAQNSREENELDVFASDSSFRINRLFIWALPLLGFLGTIYGVSFGIGGFADFLRGDVTAEQIKYQVGLITQGLAIAFYTTLLGLICAGAASFPSLGAERKEEEMLGALDELIQERLISKMPSVKKAEFPVEHIKAIREGIADLQAHMAQPMQELARQIEDGFRRLPSPQRYEEIFATAISRAGDMIAERHSEFMIRYELRIGELGEALSGRLTEVANQFRSGADTMAGSLHTQADRLTANVERQLAHQQETQKAILATIDSASTREAARWKEVSDDLRRQVGEAAGQLGQAVQSLRDASALASRGADEAARGLASQMTKLVDVGARIEQMLHTAKAMEQALQGLSSADDFRKMISEMRQHLQASDDALKKFSRPKQIVLQESR